MHELSTNCPCVRNYSCHAKISHRLFYHSSRDFAAFVFSILFGLFLYIYIYIYTLYIRRVYLISANSPPCWQRLCLYIYISGRQGCTGHQATIVGLVMLFNYSLNGSILLL